MRKCKKGFFLRPPGLRQHTVFRGKRINKLPRNCAFPPLIPEKADEAHSFFLSAEDDDYYIKLNHEMTKSRFISSLAAVYQDSVSVKKLYPEGEAAARFNKSGLLKIYFYCNRDGLLSINTKKYPAGNLPAGCFFNIRTSIPLGRRFRLGWNPLNKPLLRCDSRRES